MSDASEWVKNLANDLVRAGEMERDAMSEDLPTLKEALADIAEIATGEVITDEVIAMQTIEAIASASLQNNARAVCRE